MQLGTPGYKVRTAAPSAGLVLILLSMDPKLHTRTTSSADKTDPKDLIAIMLTLWQHPYCRPTAFRVAHVSAATFEPQHNGVSIDGSHCSKAASGSKQGNLAANYAPVTCQRFGIRLCHYGLVTWITLRRCSLYDSLTAPSKPAFLLATVLKTFDTMAGTHEFSYPTVWSSRESRERSPSPLDT